MAQQIGTFDLGQVVATPGVLGGVSAGEMVEALHRHAQGDWGEVCPEDWKSNDEAVTAGMRLLSSYTSTNGVKFWIITEHDRSVTTFLLPSEY